MAPPSMRRTRTARIMSALRCRRADCHAGQPSPFEIDTETTSKGWDSSFADAPDAIAALNSRAPSRYARAPSLCAVRQIASRFGRVKHHAAAAIMRVLDGDERRRRKHHVAGRLEGRAESASVNSPPRPIARELHAGIGAAGAGFVPDHVGFVAEHDVVAGPGHDLERDLVGHRAARNEDRRLLAEQVGDPFLQQVHRRIFAILVVADLGLGHRAPHARRWFRDGVRTEIDSVHEIL